MHKRTDGFTLVELMVVVLIIGIIVAVAVPVFQAARSRAEKNTCQSFQRTWAGVVQQVKANDQEPTAATAEYKKLAANESVWYAVANGTYLKRIPVCPTTGTESYWVYQSAGGSSGNGSVGGCCGTAAMTWSSEHALYSEAYPVPHRFWRILASGQSIVYSNPWGFYRTHFESIAFYASANGSADPADNLCAQPGVTVKAISQAPFTPASNAADDRVNATVWETNYPLTVAPWWGIDLGAGKSSEVHAVYVHSAQGYWAPSYALQWSDDTNSDWNLKAWNTQGAPLQFPAEYTTFTFETTFTNL